MLDHAKVRLGKLDYKHDPKTLKMARYIVPSVRPPAHFDFDKGKAPFPFPMFGNDAWGDCVIAARANKTLRLERIEQRRTIKITDQDAVTKYQQLTGSQSPGDANDTGLVILEAMKDWRSIGWIAAGKNYTTYAFGEVSTETINGLQLGIFLLSGVTFGFQLPAAVQGKSEWSYNGETGAEWEPGSWGGHCVESKAYYDGGFEVITWGQKVKVNNAFIAKYADEAWAVVDNKDSWVHNDALNFEDLAADLRTVTGN